MLNGSYLDYQNNRLISILKNTVVLTVKKTGNSIEYRISDRQNVQGSLFENSTYNRESSDIGVYTRVQTTPMSYMAENKVNLSTNRAFSPPDWYSALLQITDTIRQNFFHRLFFY